MLYLRCYLRLKCVGKAKLWLFRTEFYFDNMDSIHDKKPSGNCTIILWLIRVLKVKNILNLDFENWVMDFSICLGKHTLPCMQLSIITLINVFMTRAHVWTLPWMWSVLNFPSKSLILNSFLISSKMSPLFQHLFRNKVRTRKTRRMMDPQKVSKIQEKTFLWHGGKRLK